MDDTRLHVSQQECMDVLAELERDTPDVERAVELLEAAADRVVTIIDEGLRVYGKRNRDMNALDSAVAYINGAINLLQRNGPWVFSHAQKFTGDAVDALQIVLSGNVFPLASRRRPHNPGGGNIA